MSADRLPRLPIAAALLVVCRLLSTHAEGQVPKAVSVEPMGVPPGQTSTLVVRGLNLQDATSLWTSLRAPVTPVTTQNPTTKERVSSIAGKNSPPAGTLIFEAEDYARGTWGKRPPFILNVGGGNANIAEWDVHIAAAGNYVLELNYASGGDRPVKLSLNGTVLTDQAAKTQTGGFGATDSRWVPECVLSLRMGTNTIRMERTGGTPHFDKLALVPTEDNATQFAFSEPTDRIAPWRMEVPSETAVGVHGLRVATAAGISNLLLFMIDDLPTVREIAAKTAEESGQMLTLPVGVEGSCDTTHADRYAIDVSAGDVLSFEVVAARLGTSLDPILKILDASGKELTFADDTPGMSGDCCTRYQFSESGRYFVCVEDALNGGSSSYRYRMRIGDFPLIASPVPGAVQRGRSTELRFSGLAAEGIVKTVVADAEDAVVSVSAAFPDRTGSGFTQLAVRPYPQIVIDSGTADHVAAIPCGISGQFSRPGEVHHFQLDLTKGQRIQITDRSRSRGVPALVAISIQDQSGGPLADVRQAGPAGQSLSWTAPREGRYNVGFSELTGRAGSEFGYYAEVEDAAPDFQLAVEQDNSILPQNGYAIMKVTANRQGYNGPVHLSVTGLGDSPELRNNIIAEKAKETRLKIYVPSSLNVGDTRGMEIVGTATIEGQQVQRTARTISAFRKAMPQTTFPPAGLDGRVAVSVGPEIPDFFSLSLDGGAVLFPRLVGEVYFTVRVQNRASAFTDMVRLSVEGLPAGFSASGGERAVSRSDNNEYRYLLRGPVDIDRSDGHIRIVGEATFQGQTKEVELAKVPFRVIDPLIITATAESGLAAGARGSLLLKARRFVPRAGGDKAEILIDFDSVPMGITLPKTAVIPAGRNEARVNYSVADDVAFTTPLRITARTVVRNENVAVTATVEEPPE